MGTRIFCAKCKQLLEPDRAKGHRCMHDLECATSECEECASQSLERMSTAELAAAAAALDEEDEEDDDVESA